MLPITPEVIESSLNPHIVIANPQSLVCRSSSSSNPPLTAVRLFLFSAGENTISTSHDEVEEEDVDDDDVGGVVESAVSEKA